MVVFAVYFGGLALGVTLGSDKRNQSWRPVVDVGAPMATVVGIILVLYMVRRAIQARNAAGPGVVDITVFPAAPPGRISTDQIAAELRRALTDVYLSGPSVVPGESARQDFLTDVRGVAEHARTPWGALAAALSLLSPRNVYRVFCTAQADDSSGQHAFTVEVSGAPRQDVSVTTIRGETWEQITRRAACHIAAYVLPRTKVSRRPPWTPWHGIKLNPELFFHFHEARRLARAGRLEEALYHFNESMALDPLNPYIRIERATVQDELGLFVDALGSYVDVVTIESWHDGPVWRRYRTIFNDSRGDIRRLLPRSPNGAAALQVARYRMVASLAAGHRLATQWCNNVADNALEHAPQPGRYREASRVMRGLRPLLAPYAELMMNAHGVPKGRRQAVRDGLGHDDLEILRRIFQFAALDEAAAIERDYRWYRHRRWATWARLPISQPAIRIMPIWAVLQYHYVEYAQHGQHEIPLPLRQPLKYPWMNPAGSRIPGIGGKSSIRWLRRVDAAVGWPAGQTGRNNASASAWPPDPYGLSSLLTTALGRRLVFRTFTAKRGWQEHYNAACAFAVGMITSGLPPVRGGAEDSYRHHEHLVRLAVDELSRAAVAADSQFVGQQSVWLRRGDQDLDELRITPEYITFVERYLPDPGAWTLPSNPTRLVVSGHIIRIIKEYAELRESFWREQTQQLIIETADFGAEADWWRVLREVCLDYRDWRARLQLIRHAMTLSGSMGKFSAVMSSHDSWLGRQPANPGVLILKHSAEGSQLERRVREWIERSRLLNADADDTVTTRNARLDGLGIQLTEPLNLESALGDALRAAAARPFQDPLSQQLAAHLAESWQAVARWVTHGPAAAGAAPSPELGRLRQLAAERPPG